MVTGVIAFLSAATVGWQRYRWLPHLRVQERKVDGSLDPKRTKHSSTSERIVEGMVFSSGIQIMMIQAKEQRHRPTHCTSVNGDFQRSDEASHERH